MANVINRWPDNAAGRFYVDEQCIDCDICRDNVPSVFGRNAVGAHSYVRCQPASAETVRRCMAVMDLCPVGAVGMEAASAPARQPAGTR